MLCNLRNCGTGENRAVSKEKERRQSHSSVRKEAWRMAMK